MLLGEQTNSTGKPLDIGKIKDELVRIFSKDLTKELAGPFVEGLLSKVKTLDDVKSNYVDIIHKIYNPIIYKFAEDIKEKCSYYGAIPLCTARDSWPIYWALKRLNAGPVIAYLTRGIFGEKDEINKELQEGSPKTDIIAYIKQETTEQPFMIVDTGMYGSLIQIMNSWPELKDSFVGAMFLFSKNPNIYGFLNKEWDIDVEKLAGWSISLDVLSAFAEGDLDKNTKKYVLANIIVDSLECIHPMWMRSPTKIENRNGIYRPILEKQSKSRESQEFLVTGWEAMKSAYSKPNGSMPSFDQLEQLIEAAKVEFTGILPTVTPEWSGKPEFLKSWTDSKLYPLENED